MFWSLQKLHHVFRRKLCRALRVNNSFLNWFGFIHFWKMFILLSVHLVKRKLVQLVILAAHWDSDNVQISFLKNNDKRHSFFLCNWLDNKPTSIPRWVIQAEMDPVGSAICCSQHWGMKHPVTILPGNRSRLPPRMHPLLNPTFYGFSGFVTITSSIAISKIVVFT